MSRRRVRGYMMVASIDVYIRKKFGSKGLPTGGEKADPTQRVSGLQGS